MQLITTRENCSKDKINKSSIYLGVDFHKLSNKCRARCRIKSKSIYLGLFLTEEEAHFAYITFLENLKYGKYIEE